MSAIERIAHSVGRRDEVPNQELARDLAEGRDTEGIAEIADHLADGNPRVASDCIKVLYEIGYIDPTLIGEHTDAFIDLLHSRKNRMVWGAMIALWTVSNERHGTIWARIDEVLDAFDSGSVITVVSGVKALAVVASKDPAYEERLRPVLLRTLRECKPKLVATHSEDMLVMVNDANREEYQSIIKERREDLSPSQAARLGKVERRLENGPT